MKVSVIFPNDEAYINIEKNIKKINALLVKQTVSKKVYGKQSQAIIMRELLQSVGLTSNDYTK